MTKENDFTILKENDIYSLSLFTLYKLMGIKEYSLISELPYILDKKSMLDFCTYFGGRTIKVPTVDEIKSIMHLILLYQYVKIDNISYSEAVSLIGYKSTELRKVKVAFSEMCNILDNYNFNRG